MRFGFGGVTGFVTGPIAVLVEEDPEQDNAAAARPPRNTSRRVIFMRREPSALRIDDEAEILDVARVARVAVDHLTTRGYSAGGGGRSAYPKPSTFESSGLIILRAT